MRAYCQCPSADVEQRVRCPHDQYSSTEHTHGLRRHASFLAYEEPLGMTLACMVLCPSALTDPVPGAFVRYCDAPIVEANNCILSYVLLIVTAFHILCSLLFIGHPNIVTCALKQTTFGVFVSCYVYCLGKDNYCSPGLQAHYSRKKDENDPGIGGT